MKKLFLILTLCTMLFAVNVNAQQEETTLQRVRILINDALDQLGNTTDLTLLMDALEQLRDEFEAYKLATDARLNILENTVVIPDPTSPTLLVATAHATLMQIGLVWVDPTSLCDSIYVRGQKFGLDGLAPVIAVVDSGVQAYTHTGLDPATQYEYLLQTVKWINGVAVTSNYSNTATATTTIDTPPVFISDANIDEDWEQGSLDSSFATEDGVTTDGTIALEIADPITGNYSMSARVDSALGYAYEWYKLPSPLVDGDTLWIKFNIEADYLTGAGESSNYKYIFALGDTVSGSFRAAVKLSLRKQNNDDGLYDARINNNNNTLTSVGQGLDSVIELNRPAEVLIAIQTGYDSVDNFVKVWVSNFSQGNMQQTYSSNPFTTRNSTTYIESEYIRLGVENITSSLGDKFTYDDLVVASDSASLFAQVDTSEATGTGGGGYESVYFVSNAATGTGVGSLADPFTLAQAKSIVVPGDTVIVPLGLYDHSSGGSYSKNGTSGLPIVWIGTQAAGDYDALTADGDSSTVFYSNTSTNGPISLSGNYNIFDKIIFRQDYNARQLISVSGTGVVLDSCAVKYPSNVSSSSNHTIVVTGAHVTFKYSHFYNGSRTIMWIRKNSGTQADFFTMEYCTLTGARNHPPIQIFPATNSTDTTTLKRPIVRNCLFVDNPYGDGIYSRYCEQFAFYNNLFIRSDGPYNIDIHTGFHYPTGTPADTCNSKGGIVAYNTIIVEGQANIIFNKGSNQTKFVNNVVYSTDPVPDMIFRLDGAWNAIYRHQFDYNLYDYVDVLATGNGVRGTWGSANTSVWYYNWDNVTGQETNSTVDVTPTWNNTNAVGGYRPPNVGAPQTAKGIPVTTANGFWMNITTDYYGNTRDAVNPTIGHSNYIGE